MFIVVRFVVEFFSSVRQNISLTQKHAGACVHLQTCMTVSCQLEMIWTDEVAQQWFDEVLLWRTVYKNYPNFCANTTHEVVRHPNFICSLTFTTTQALLASGSSCSVCLIWRVTNPGSSGHHWEWTRNNGHHSLTITPLQTRMTLCVNEIDRKGKKSLQTLTWIRVCCSHCVVVWHHMDACDGVLQQMVLCVFIVSGENVNILILICVCDSVKGRVWNDTSVRQ